MPQKKVETPQPNQVFKNGHCLKTIFSEKDS